MKTKWIRRILWFTGSLLVVMNVMAWFHAYRFTHFDATTEKRTNAGTISFGEKLLILFTGVKFPRPVTKRLPATPYGNVVLQSDGKIACWLMKADNAKGTVILFHGYGGEKSDMLDRAAVIMGLGYHVLLPDFRGAGASAGDQCTVGFKEARDVQTCIDYVSGTGEHNIVLLGTSMGAAAVMKAMQRSQPSVKGIILECPFASMRQTVQNRFELVGVPSFPLSDFLVLWGGVQHGFNAFAHNPEDYARKIKTPVLLLCGARDDRVKRSEIENIYAALQGRKQLTWYPLAGHESYLNKYREAWTADVSLWLSAL